MGQSPVLQELQRLGPVRIRRRSAGRPADPPLARIRLLQYDKPHRELEGQPARRPQAATGRAQVQRGISHGAGRENLRMREKVPLSGFPLLTYKLRTGGVTW